jgi:hypothetical protein
MHRRTAISHVILAAMAAPAVLEAQTPATPTPQQPLAGPGKGPTLAFASAVGIVLSPVLKDQAGAFEEVMEKVKEALLKSTDPVRRQQAAGWIVYKAAEPYQTHLLYVSIMNPAVKDADYNVFDVLQAHLGDADARLAFQKFRTAFAGPQHVLNLDAVTVMAPPQQA